jgi:hypothetical protein
MFDWTTRMMNAIRAPLMTMSAMPTAVSTAFSLSPPPDRIVRLDVRAMMRRRAAATQGGQPDRGRLWSRGTSSVSSEATSTGRAPRVASSSNTASRSSWHMRTITRAASIR